MISYRASNLSQKLINLIKKEEIMDFNDTPEEAKFRKEASDWLKQNFEKFDSENYHSKKVLNHLLS